MRTSRETELRALFREGQLGQQAYQQAALQTRDPALAVLYTDLAREEGICCNRLVTVLEEGKLRALGESGADPAGPKHPPSGRNET